MESRRNNNLYEKDNILSVLTHLDNTLSTEEQKKYFVSFMSINKKGININSVYATPVGLYCYPLPYLIKNAKNQISSLDIRPFPREKVNHIKVFKIINDKNVKFINDTIDSNTKQKIHLLLGNNSGEINTFKDLWVYLYQHKWNTKSASSLLTVQDILLYDDEGIYSNYTKEQLQQICDEINANEHPIDKNIIARQAAVFFKRLNIDAIIDNGTSTIHPNEPVQAVFLNATILQTIHDTGEITPFKYILDIINNGTNIIELTKLPSHIGDEILSNYKFLAHMLNVLQTKLTQSPINVQQYIVNNFITKLLLIPHIQKQLFLTVEQSCNKKDVMIFDCIINVISQFITNINFNTNLYTFVILSLHIKNNWGFDDALHNMINDENSQKHIEYILSHVKEHYNKAKLKHLLELIPFSQKLLDKIKLSNIYKHTDIKQIIDKISVTNTNLMEARKNPEINTRKTVMDQLEDISHQIIINNENINDYFISFMDINKTGINIQTQYNTPVGLYCYPLGYVIDRSKTATNSLQIRPFPNHKVKYIKIYKVKNKNNIFDMSDNINNTVLKNMKEYFEDFDSTSITTFRQLWRYIYLEKIGINSDVTSKFKSAAATATSMFRKLGIDGFIDMGTGTIHPNEPCQAVFFNTTCLTVVDVIGETTTELFFSNLKNEIVGKQELIKPIYMMLEKTNSSDVLQGINNFFKIIMEQNFLNDTDKSSMWYIFCELFVHYFTINNSVGRFNILDTVYLYKQFNTILNKLTESQCSNIIDMLSNKSPSICYHIFCSYELSTILSNHMEQLHSSLINDNNFADNLLDFLGLIIFYADKRILTIKKTYNIETINHLLDMALNRRVDAERLKYIVSDLKRLKVHVLTDSKFN